MLGIRKLFADPAGPVGRIMEEKAYNVEGVMKELLLIPGSGRLYTHKFFRGRAGRFLSNGREQVPGKLYQGALRPAHRASAPGMPPASDSGQLLGSIGHELTEDDGMVAAKVYAEKYYALYLEFGTRYMDERPFMRPALEIGVKM